MVDATDYPAMQEAAERIQQELGRCDHLVYAAGAGSGKYGFPFWNLEPCDWEKVLRVNLQGAVNTAHAFAPRLIETRDGTMLFLSSVAGQIGSQTDPPYSAAKAGLKNFCRVLAMELEGTGVRVTHLRLGPTLSEFGLSWPQETMVSVLDSWQPFGLTRNMAFMDPSTVADAVIHALDAPRTASYANIELQPTAPPRSSE